MKKRIDEHKLIELEKLRRRILFIIDYLAGKGLEDSSVVELKRLIDTACEKGNLKGLRMAASDMEEWASGLPVSDREELEHRLQEELDINLSDERAALLVIVQKIVARGKISNLTEYELISRWVARIYDDATKTEEVRQLNELLAGYRSPLKR